MSTEHKSAYFDVIMIDEIHEIKESDIPREWNFKGIDRGIMHTVDSPPPGWMRMPVQRPKPWLLVWLEEMIEKYKKPNV